MSQIFKNKIGTVSTTGSNVDLITCPSNKTILIRNIRIFNENASTATQTLYFIDNSQSSSTAILWGDSFTVTASNSAVFSTRFVLEENDKIQFQTSHNAQKITINYVEIDNFDSGNKTRYKHTSFNSTTEDSYVYLLTPSAGHAMIVKTLALKNLSGSDSTASLRLIEATTNTYVPIMEATIEDDTSVGDGEFDYFISSRTIVLEAGDSLQLQMSEQPWTSIIHYMEIPELSSKTK